MKPTKNQIWVNKTTNGKYKIIKVEYLNETILNIKMQNVNNKSLFFDLGEWELINNYNLTNFEILK